MPTENNLDNLVNFNGTGKYSDPEFVWKDPTAPTALTFLNSDKLGKQYKNDMFVPDILDGRIYHFKLNEERDGLILSSKSKTKLQILIKRQEI